VAASASRCAVAASLTKNEGLTTALVVIVIHGWLGTSVSRTTIFAQVVLYSEVAVWLVIAVQAASAWMAEEGSGIRKLVSDYSGLQGTS
jgi:hypothetical protein